MGPIRQCFAYGLAVCLVPLAGCHGFLRARSDVATADMPVAEVEPPAQLSGELDGPTLRLALHDLAIILDLLGRLEAIDPELKTRMLGELAEADATHAVDIVKAWQARVAELEAADGRIRVASATRLVRRSAAAELSLPQPSPESFVAEAASPPAAVVSASPPAVLLAPPTPPALDNLPRQELVRLLASRSSERAAQSGDARERVRLALIDILAQADADHPPSADPELWDRLAPALEICLGTRECDEAALEQLRDGLRQASERLDRRDPLELRKLTFCRRIRGFGNIEPAPESEFEPGQAMLLYSEVANFASETAADGFRTRIGSTLTLVAADGRTVWQEPFPAADDASGTVRTDYFLSHTFQLPRTLSAGHYALRLTLRDELAGRSATASIALRIR